jgi:hypothetical protein
MLSAQTKESRRYAEVTNTPGRWAQDQTSSTAKLCEIIVLPKNAIPESGRLLNCDSKDANCG